MKKLSQYLWYQCHKMKPSQFEILIVPLSYILKSFIFLIALKNRHNLCYVHDDAERTPRLVEKFDARKVQYGFPQKP